MGLIREESGEGGSNLRMVLSGNSLRMSQVIKLFENWCSLAVF